ncbi:rhodanese-like domain-containing protein [Capnocytophaga canis]|uniref:Rhodanese-like domain-containing protein n=2 Tax=Capnocytophaga canis TaxID=1848903 RepID=A0A3A1YHX7_9FLAO|nr:rhodanese-like domain-containing protein [Capnocytophaga canis]
MTILFMVKFNYNECKLNKKRIPMKKSILILAMGLFSCSNIPSEKNIKIKDYEPKATDKLVDIRTAEEFADGHLKGAVNIDFFEDDFLENFEKQYDKEDTVYIYCKSGGRSSKAYAILEKAGFKNLMHLDGGFMQWSGTGKPVEK